MQKIDLLPCPFCGRMPKRSELNIQLWIISCSFSKCHAHPWVIKGTPEEAAKAWNTRASGFIPCSERMPGRFDTVLIAILSKNGYGEPAYYVTIGGMKNGNEFESYTGDICEFETVTHWMPLPAVPEVTSNADE